ncbi:hypothetical protein [Methylohalobius crimeensis]|uniref:hypothetical protein n=1 Tax=Methylohalobius crimeensis TaxID=244365 RepID=UPI0003B68F7C|nr:hypothetical protein [Methylohalobius crimeensis]
MPPMRRISLGFTLLELTVVLLVLLSLAAVVLPYTQGTVSQAACQATDATMAAVRDAIMGSAAGPGYYSDIRNHLPYYRDGSGNEDCHDDTATGGDPHYHLHFLVNASTFDSANPKSLCPGSLGQFKPRLALGWRGPYLQGGGGKLVDPTKLNSSFSKVASNPPTNDQYVHFDHTATGSASHENDYYVLDHYRWRNPIVLQVPDDNDSDPNDCIAIGYPNGDGKMCARLVSAGPDGILNTQIIDADASKRGDDRVLFLRIPDPYSEGNLPCAD